MIGEGDIPAATAEDVELAVSAARDAFGRDGGRHWSRAPGAVRAKYLKAIAAKIKDKKSYLALLETLDSGKPLDEAAGDMVCIIIHTMVFSMTQDFPCFI